MDAGSKAETSETRFIQESVRPPGAAMNVVRVKTVNLQFSKDEEDYSIPVRQRVLKSIRQDRIESQAWARLLSNEAENLKKLNVLKNPHVPTVLNFESGESNPRLEMTYLFGERRDMINYRSRETRLIILRYGLEAIDSIFRDGFVNLDYAPRNMIVVFDHETGKPTSASWVDFGFSYPINKNGDVVIDRDLLRETRFNWMSWPPEIEKGKGLIKANAEKLLVWSVDHWLGEIGTEFNLRCQRSNPKKRPTWNEFLEHYQSKPIDESKIESIDSRKLKEFKGAQLGRQDNEIFIDEKQLEKALKDFPTK